MTTRGQKSMARNKSLQVLHVVQFTVEFESVLPSPFQLGSKILFLPSM